ncbi:hypothetical protein ATANTOWER_027790 [Ataeniobius toweri]|uniref:Secreted protein n=1 Tax=Ataeniobius toweri TaxID=208326 RepID=A0ABU7B2U0_9TELE|nr:hypothetical protein [Ataeniobius toweri]
MFLRFDYVWVVFSSCHALFSLSVSVKQSASFSPPAPCQSAFVFPRVSQYIYTIILFIPRGNISAPLIHAMPFSAITCLSEFYLLNQFTRHRCLLWSAFWGLPPHLT